MKYLYDTDIWSKYDEGDVICITTNAGWNKRGQNVMGAGIALSAAKLFPHMASNYGKYLQKKTSGNGTVSYLDVVKFVLQQTKKWDDDQINKIMTLVPNVILVVTKELNPQEPHLSWKKDSKLSTIEESLQELVRIRDRQFKEREIVVPALGCSCGGLSTDVVFPLMEKYLDDGFTLVVRGSK